MLLEELRRNDGYSENLQEKCHNLDMVRLLFFFLYFNILVLAVVFSLFGINSWYKNIMEKSYQKQFSAFDDLFKRNARRQKGNKSTA